ncbi:two-component sensor histidine kinase [Algibacter marinivivus]|uniref:histidine kinase n=1 Tax=Algibacter marinivivus TaxID=2100723 RepID=A0A2U2X9N3_9FLAO|nr:sensor histidine kinase [Algibacter marinivivus]PWH84494.1 two-component sensor histidine kinase [Algibacter marinivivus]
MKKTVLSFLFVLVSFHCISQNNLKIIDSLKLVIESKPNDSIKIKTYSDLCWYYGRISNDSAFHYGNLALKLSQKTNNVVGEAQAYNDLGIIHTYSSNFDESIKLYRKALKIRKTINDSMGIASIYNKLCYAYHKKFEMDSCLTYNLKALDIYTALGSKRHIFLSKGNVAAVYESMNQYDNALKVHFETLEMSKDISDSLGLSNIYLNIGNTYLSKKDTLKGLSYYDKCIKIGELNGYDNTLAIVYSDYGIILEGQKKYKEALKFYQKSYQLSKKIDADVELSEALLNLGNINTITGNYNDAKAKLYEGLKLSKKTQAKDNELKAYELLLHYYSKRKNTDSILHYYSAHKKLNSSIYSNRVTEEIAEVQERYNTAEREKEILTQRADIAEKELNLNKKNTQLIGLGVLAIVLSVLGYLLFSQQKLKNRQLQKEKELSEALIKIETQNRLQEQRLRISRDLHDNIGAQLTFIISSIENLQYGFKIKNEKLTNKLSNISGFTKETIYELRDTIWAMNKNAISLEDLETRISNFIDKADVSASSIQFDFKIDKAISKNIKFTSVEGMNIYRIIQEAVNNAIKYSEAKTVLVNVFKKDQSVQIEIQDDGKGFDLNMQKDGNGLNNIKKRAQDIDALLSITSSENKGTSIILQL